NCASGSPAAASSTTSAAAATSPSAVTPSTWMDAMAASGTAAVTSTRLEPSSVSPRRTAATGTSAETTTRRRGPPGSWRSSRSAPWAARVNATYSNSSSSPSAYHSRRVGVTACASAGGSSSPRSLRRASAARVAGRYTRTRASDTAGTPESADGRRPPRAGADPLGPPSGPPGEAQQASAVAGGVAHRPGQPVDVAPDRAVRGPHRQPLPDPVLDAAEHLLDPEAERGQRQRRAGAAVAAGSPAVRHDGNGRVEFGRRPVRDLVGGQVPGARDVRLHPSGGTARVEQHEAGVGQVQGGVDVGGGGVPGE